MIDWMPVSTDTAYMYVKPFWNYNTSCTISYGGYYSTATVEDVQPNTIYTYNEPVKKKRRKVATLK